MLQDSGTNSKNNVVSLTKQTSSQKLKNYERVSDGKIIENSKTIKSIDLDGYEHELVVEFKEIDLSDLNNPPMGKNDILLTTTQLMEMFNWPEGKAKISAEILFDDSWSIQKLKDAIKFVLKNKPYRDIMPADIFQYKKSVKYFNYGEMLKINGTTSGFKPVCIPFDKNIDPTTKKEIPWWVKSNEDAFEEWTVQKEAGHGDSPE